MTVQVILTVYGSVEIVHVVLMDNRILACCELYVLTLHTGDYLHVGIRGDYVLVMVHV